MSTGSHLVADEDKRNNRRRRTYALAQLESSTGISLGDATVRDLSDSGARLTLPAGMAVTNDVRVRLSDQLLRPAFVMWRRGLEIGVRFTDAMAAHGEDRVSRLEAEIERLRTDFSRLCAALRSRGVIE